MSCHLSANSGPTFSGNCWQTPCAFVKIEWCGTDPRLGSSVCCECVCSYECLWVVTALMSESVRCTYLQKFNDNHRMVRFHEVYQTRSIERREYVRWLREEDLEESQPLLLPRCVDVTARPQEAEYCLWCEPISTVQHKEGVCYLCELSSLAARFGQLCRWLERDQLGRLQ